DFTREELTDLRRELVSDLRPFSFTNALDDPLLRRLYGGAPEDGEVHRLLEHVTNLETAVEQAGVLGRDFPRAVLDDVDYRPKQDDLDVALPFIDVDLGLNGRAVFFCQRSEN